MALFKTNGVHKSGHLGTANSNVDYGASQNEIEGSNHNQVTEEECSWGKIDSGSRSLKIEWLTTKQAAEYLCLSMGAFRNMVSNGQIPFYKLGRRNRYRLVDLRELLLAEKRGALNGN
jgi:excisionase family DNA binding protein